MPSKSSIHITHIRIGNYNVIYSLYLQIIDQRDQGEKQRRKMTASGDAVSLVVQNLRPGTVY